MVNFDKVLGDIKDWEEWMSIKEVSLEEKKLKKSRTIKEGLKKKKDYFFMIGFIFCLFQLIGVQEGIIILNSLFSEIFDEFKLWLNGHLREFYFYQCLSSGRFFHHLQKISREKTILFQYCLSYLFICYSRKNISLWPCFEFYVERPMLLDYMI